MSTAVMEKSFKRDRSRSPRRFDDWDAKAAEVHLDVKDIRIDILKEQIKNFEAIVQSKDNRIASMEMQVP